MNTFILLVHCCFCIFFDVAAGKCNGFTLFFFYSIVAPQFAIDLEKRKSNVKTFILLVQGLVCIFFDVTAGECNVLTLCFFLF